jgi:hypothetical protein
MHPGGSFFGHDTVAGVLKRAVRSRAIAVSSGERVAFSRELEPRHPTSISSHTIRSHDDTEDLVTRRKVNKA